MGKYIIISIGVVIIGALAFLSDLPDNTSSKPVLCYLATDLSNGFNVKSAEYMKKFGIEAGFAVRILNATKSAERQNSQVETAVATGASVIIIKAVDNNLIISSLKKAIAAGVKVIAYDNTILGCATSLSSILDTIKVGEAAAEECVSRLVKKYGSPKGVIFQIMGDLGDSYSVFISQGFNRKIKAYPNITLITRDCPKWRGQAKATEKMLSGNKNLDAIFMHSDSHMTEIITVLAKKGYKPGDVILVGTDGDPDALKGIRKGWVQATIGVPLVQQVRGAYQFMDRIIGGTEIVEGEYSIRGITGIVKIVENTPVLYLPGTIINRENVDEPTLWGNMNVRQ